MRKRFGGGMADMEKFNKWFLTVAPGKIFKDFNHDLAFGCGIT